MKAAVFPVPDCDWAIMFCGGSASNVGNAVSWILLGALSPIAYTPLSNSGFRLSASKLLTENNGEFGFRLSISKSCLLSTRPRRRTLSRRLLSATVIGFSSSPPLAMISDQDEIKTSWLSLSICQSIYLFIYQFIILFFNLHTYLSISLSVNLSIDYILPQTRDRYQSFYFCRECLNISAEWNDWRQTNFVPEIIDKPNSKLISHSRWFLPALFVTLSSLTLLTSFSWASAAPAQSRSFTAEAISGFEFLINVRRNNLADHKIDEKSENKICRGWNLFYYICVNTFGLFLFRYFLQSLDTVAVSIKTRQTIGQL